MNKTLCIVASVVVSATLAGCSVDSELLNKDTYLEGEGDLRPADDIARDVSEAVEKDGPALEAALSAAQKHVDAEALSQDALIEQLKLDGFTEESIDFAMDNVNADYSKEAKEALRHIEDTTGLSKEEMVDLLVADGFTREAIKCALKDY